MTSFPTNKTNNGQRPADYTDIKGSPNWLDWLVNGLVLVITAPINFFAKFLNAFVERGGPGIQALGGVAFLAGVFAGTDNFFQLFTGVALLPWFTENTWAGSQSGWFAVLMFIPSFTFLIAIALSLTTQFIQGQAVRGRSLAMAQAEFDKWNKPTMPGVPDAMKKLDMATVSYKELKRVGKNQRSFIGFIALLLWGFEIISGFAAHNPLNYMGQPGLFLGCLAYALVTIVAGETGYTLYCAAKEESSGS